MSSIKSISLQNFRNHLSFRKIISTDKKYIIIQGKNGVGKTSILESISLFSNGNGLHQVPLHSISKHNSIQPFGVNISMRNKSEDIFSELSMSLVNGNRIIKEDNNKTTFKLVESKFCVMWITPHLDHFFRESNSQQLNFIQIFIAKWDTNFKDILSRYTSLIEERRSVLLLQKFDNNKKSSPSDYSDWLDGIECQLVPIATEIAQINRLYCKEINKVLLEDGFIFPLKLECTGLLESKLETKKASLVEEEYGLYLKKNRFLVENRHKIDGPHKSKIILTNSSNNLPGSLCSTGEKRLLMISFIMSNAKLFEDRFNFLPILLWDDVLSYLDESYRVSFCRWLDFFDTQHWLTTTDSQFFKDKFSKEEGDIISLTPQQF
ncbi:MAG: hypothetical protein JJV93_01650 [Alphaproteobacteria bacterium]|nr:hypothetical protein [Alphaproteobacteria bacterium]